MDFTPIFVDVLLHHKTKQERNRRINFASILQNTPESNIITKIKILVLMKLEPCIFLELFINFSDFEPQNSYKFYSYSLLSPNPITYHLSNLQYLPKVPGTLSKNYEKL